MEKFFAPGGPLASCFENYELRQGQVSMAEGVLQALEGSDSTDGYTGQSKIFMVEAGTGIGKTLAYLVPAVLVGKKVIISTATLNLQDQILHKDIPLVERALQKKISAFCVKGRQNYLCLYRWYQYRSSPQLTLVDDPRLEKVDDWLRTTATGDKAELNWLEDGGGSLWSKISCTSSQCMGGECPEGGGCFVNSMRKQSGNAQILIVNHSLFFSDLAVRRAGFGEVLPRCECVIFDEAHHLENVATQFFGETFGQFQILDLIGDIRRQAEADCDEILQDDILSQFAGMKQRLENFTAIFPAARGRFPLDPLVEKLGKQWMEEVEQLSSAMKRCATLLEGLQRYGESWSTLSKRLIDLENRFQTIANPELRNAERVTWYDRGDRSLQLSSTPIEVSSELQEYLFDRYEAVILASATLSSGGSFDYIRSRLGVDSCHPAMQIESPYDYGARTLLYVPEPDFPEPRDTSYMERMCNRVYQILEASQGRALVLCTSLKSMREIADYLEDKVDLPLYVQGRGARSFLLERFREETHSVLLAVASFWEGVDIVGEALSCVIIDKLPFEVPSDPVLKARVEKIGRDGGNAFFEFQVPRAILTLRQGVGRLVRTETDRGVICILDSRLCSKGYGRRFLRSLPPSPVTRDLEDVENFFLQGQ